MSTELGRRAEVAAATYLGGLGYRVLQQNWRTRWCEIDIVARKNDSIYLVEVKYRTNNRHGAGLEYITQRKLQQMHFAAEFWVATHGHDGDYCLGAIEVSGPDFEVTAWVDELN